jgi:uncharacterized protein
MSLVVDRIKVIDSDTHISEPTDLWTSRVSSKWGDLVPHARTDPRTGREHWYFGGKRFAATGFAAQAGWPKFPPDFPPSLAAADPAAWDVHARLKKMDEYGIFAQVIYPNVGGFGSGNFMRLKDVELQHACVRAYNDFLTDWASVAPHRFGLISALPFWDLEESLREMERCAKAGHRGILFTDQPEYFGLPMLADPHWDRLWAAAQDLGQSVNFHIGSGDVSGLEGHARTGMRANLVRGSVMMFVGNAKSVCEIIVSGICHRYPKLNFVSVESGLGWIPFLGEALDWQWLNYGCRDEHPEMDLLPSEYMKRQVYVSFWFERKSLRAALDVLGPDNIFYETDFPHPTSMAPGPASFALSPRDFIEETLGDLPEEHLQKILHDNAARVYRL